MKNLTKAPKPDFWQHHFKTMRPNFLKLTAFLTKDERLRLKKCNFRLKIHGQAMLGTVPGSFFLMYIFFCRTRPQLYSVQTKRFNQHAEECGYILSAFWNK